MLCGSLQIFVSTLDRDHRYEESEGFQKGGVFIFDNCEFEFEVRRQGDVHNPSCKNFLFFSYNFYFMINLDHFKKIEKNLETKNYGIAEGLLMGLQPVIIIRNFS